MKLILRLLVLLAQPENDKCTHINYKIKDMPPVNVLLPLLTLYSSSMYRLPFSWLEATMPTIAIIQKDAGKSDLHYALLICHGSHGPNIWTQISHIQYELSSLSGIVQNGENQCEV